MPRKQNNFPATPEQEKPDAIPITHPVHGERMTEASVAMYLLSYDSGWSPVVTWRRRLPAAQEDKEEQNHETGAE